MDVLALDLGTKTGFAYNRGAIFTCGSWELATAKEIRAWGRDRKTRTQDPRIERLCRNITGLRPFTIVIFEDVQFSTYTAQTQLWSSLRSCVWLCASANVMECIPVSTLKKYATGTGAATKQLMAKRFWVEPEFAGVKSADDNAIDAAWAWKWAHEKFKRMKL
jgi:hypothetical protein